MSKKYNNKSEQVDAAWNKLEPLLVDDAVIVKIKPALFNKRFFAAAAALFLVATFGLLFFRDYNSQIVYSTKYGETSQVTLPDSSVVFLNGHTRLSFRKNWSHTGDREVKIDGEAYFSIKHTKTNQRFFVRMGEGLSVEVLGTEFNISKRASEIRVVLNSGKINFHMNAQNRAEGETIIMKPGDLIEYQSESQTYTKGTIDPEINSSWKSSRLVFDKTTLKDVLRTIQDTYGLKIMVKDPELMNRKVSGSAPSKNIDILIKGLSEIFDLSLTKKGDTLIVSSINLNN